MRDYKLGLPSITKLLSLLGMFSDVQAAQHLVKFCEQDLIDSTEYIGPTGLCLLQCCIVFPPVRLLNNGRSLNEFCVLGDIVRKIEIISFLGEQFLTCSGPRGKRDATVVSHGTEILIQQLPHAILFLLHHPISKNRSINVGYIVRLNTPFVSSKEQHVLLADEIWVKGTASVLQVFLAEHGELEVILSTAINIGGSISLPPSVHMADGFNALVIKSNKASLIMESFHFDHAAGGHFFHTQPHE